jgi:hypothetical protein
MSVFDVGGCQYREDGSSWTPSGAASLTWNPAEIGSHTLWVRAVSSAGLPGAEATYRFAIDPSGARRQGSGRSKSPADSTASPATATACTPGTADSPLYGFRGYGPVLLAASTSINGGGCPYVSYKYALWGNPRLSALTFEHHQMSMAAWKRAADVHYPSKGTT